MILRRVLEAVLALLMAFVAAPGLFGQAPPPLPTVNSDYRVGPGDVLKLSVYRAPEFESNLRVGGDGTIQVGTIGSLAVGGLTPSQIAETIAARFQSAGIFRDPVVNVLVAEYHSKVVSVLGAVARPGQYPLDREGLTISDLLARAGATLDNGTTRISITSDGRGAAPETLTLGDLVNGTRNRPVRSGETIFVQLPPMVYVAGEVVHAGSYPITPGMTVQQAITLAGDIGPRGSRSKVRITHEASSAKPVRARLGDLVQPGDQILVGARIF